MVLQASVKLVLDFSDISGSLDDGGMIPMLAWRFTLEEALAENLGIDVVKTVPYCPSLESFYKIVRRHYLSDPTLPWVIDVLSLPNTKVSSLTVTIIDDTLIIELIK